MSSRQAANDVEEESYFISMTDLMVGVLFLFIIMLMAVALNLRQQQQVYEDTNKQLTEADQSRREMLREIKQSLESMGIDVSIDEDTGVLRLPEALLFARGKYALDERGQAALQRVAEVLYKVLPCYAQAAGGTPLDCKTRGGRLEAVFIEGHTDDVPLTRSVSLGVSDNWSLSTARAIEVFQKIISAAPVLGNMQNDRNLKLLGVSGYADNRPVSKPPADPLKFEDWRRNNRRIDLRFLMATPDPEQLRKLRADVERGIAQ